MERKACKLRDEPRIGSRGLWQARVSMGAMLVVVMVVTIVGGGGGGGGRGG